MYDLWVCNVCIKPKWDSLGGFFRGISFRGLNPLFIQQHTPLRYSIYHQDDEYTVHQQEIASKERLEKLEQSCVVVSHEATAVLRVKDQNSLIKLARKFEK